MKPSNNVRRYVFALTLSLLCAFGAQTSQAKTKAKRSAKPAAAAEAAPAPTPAAAPAPAAPVEAVEEKLEDLPSPEKSCKKDVETFCAKVKPGNNQLAACIRSHGAELEDGCKKALMGYLKKRFEQACKADVKKYCQKESTQQGGLMPCMQKNGEQLSAGCQDMIGFKKPAAAAPAPAAK